MTESEAIKFAIRALHKEKVPIKEDSAFGMYNEANSKYMEGKSSGWMVVVTLDTHLALSDPSVTVEVYEPDGDVKILISP